MPKSNNLVSKVKCPFITKWQHSIVIDGATLEWTSVTSGEVQSLTLGPVLFFTDINDIHVLIIQCITKYFDDTTVSILVLSDQFGQNLQEV